MTELRTKIVVNRVIAVLSLDLSMDFDKRTVRDTIIFYTHPVLYLQACKEKYKKA